MKQLCNDLKEEHESLDSIVSALNDSQWEIVTPFFGWRIKDEISHIAYYDESARISATDPDIFLENVKNLLDGISSYNDIVKKTNVPWYGPEDT